MTYGTLRGRFFRLLNVGLVSLLASTGDTMWKWIKVEFDESNNMKPKARDCGSNTLTEYGFAF